MVRTYLATVASAKKSYMGSIKESMHSTRTNPRASISVDKMGAVSTEAR